MKKITFLFSLIPAIVMAILATYYLFSAIWVSSVLKAFQYLLTSFVLALMAFGWLVLINFIENMIKRAKI